MEKPVRERRRQLREASTSWEEINSPVRNDSQDRGNIWLMLIVAGLWTPGLVKLLTKGSDNGT